MLFINPVFVTEKLTITITNEVKKQTYVKKIKIANPSFFSDFFQARLNIYSDQLSNKQKSNYTNEYISTAI
ncbi:hypothetical protein NOS3756_57410 (plasmid) [Nostoc sp. NIES-3756]|nr:hypothetical protein NOS3756_57410 [Nostoc sp. NIES-3756]